MQEKSSNKIDEQLLDKIIAAAYGDAWWLDRLILNRKAKKDPAIQQLLNEYKITADSIHRLKEEKLPDNLINSIQTRMNIGRKNSFISLVYERFLSRPLLSAGVMGMIIIAIISIMFLNRPQPQHKYTKAQIELAEKQFKESLAIVGRVFSQAEKKLDEDVLNKQINKSLGKGFNLVNDILIGG